MTKKYIFTKYASLHSVSTPVDPGYQMKFFKGDVVNGVLSISNGVSPSGPITSKIVLFKDPNFGGTFRVVIDANSPIKEYNIKNSIKNDTMASSYLGEGIIAKKSQQTKNILVIIAMLAILIVAYLAVTGKLFKSLELN